MPPYGEPDWSTPGAAATTAPPPVMDAPVNVNTGVGNAAPKKDRSNLWQNLISIVLIGLCASMICLGVFTLLANLGGAKDFAEYFIACYLLLFSTLLVLYELMWWCSLPSMNRTIRKNFGFIYKIWGKALYMIFVACLCLGIDKNLLGRLEWLKWFTGIGWAGMGLLLIVMKFTAPTVFEGYQPPTSGLSAPAPMNPNDMTV